MRIIRYLLLTLALLLAAIAGGVLVLAATPAGFVWLADHADRVVPGKLELAEPQGSLLGAMRVARAGYTLDDLHIEAEALSVRLNWLALLAGEVRLSRLEADSLLVTLAAGSAPETPDAGLPDVTIPVALRVVRSRIGTLRLDVPGYAGDITDLQLSAALRGSRLRVFDAAGRAFDLPLQVSAELRMRDNWNYRGTVRTRIERDGLPAVALQTNVSGDGDALRAEELLAETLGGTVAGNATLQFADLALDATLLAAGIDATAWQTQAPYLEAADISVSGRLPDRLQFSIRDARLQQAGISAVLNGRVNWDGERVTSPGAQLRAGRNQAEFNGELWPAAAGSFMLRIPEPGELRPELGGRIEARGRLTTRNGIAVTANVTAADVAWQSTPVADRIALELTGGSERQRWQLAVTSAAGAAQLTGRSTLTAESLTLDIDTAALTPAGAPPWQLGAPVSARVALDGAGGVSVGEHCWAGEPWQVCIDTADWTPQQIDLNARLLPLQLTDITELTELGYEISGTARAELRLSGAPDNPAGRLLWQQQDTRLAWTNDDGNTVQSVFGEASAELQLRDRRLRLSARAASDTGVTLNAAADSAPWQGTATPVAGRLSLDITDIALAAPLLDRFAGLDNVGGSAAASLRFSGTLAEPVLVGNAELTDGRVGVRQLGIELTDILLDVTAASSTALSFEGSARSGDGRLVLDGTARRAAAADAADDSDTDSGTALRVELNISGENVTVLRFPDQVITATPDLTLELEGNTLRIGGELLVPYADITVAEVPATASSPSRDARVVRAEVEETRAGALTVISDIRIRVGEDVRFSAFGLETRLGGQVRLYTTAENQLPYLDGNLRSLEGSFEAFGRELDIERGVLIFSGVPDNPNVDVRAVRNLRYEGEDIKIIIRLSGPLQAMQTSLSGEPAMSESDALSYLVLNRPARRTDTGESEQLSAAAMALGLVNLLPQTETLRNTLGIDEIEFEGSTRETSAITAGKRVGEDFYIRYSYGLFERVGRFIIRYEIGSGFSLEAGSGQEQTIELLYSIDR